MTTIDELGRHSAVATRADVATLAAARVESGLERLRLEGGPVVVPRRRRTGPRRWLALGIAAALTAAAIIALVVNANGSESHRLVPSGESTQLSPSPTALATTIPPDTTGLDQNPPDTVPAASVPTDAIAVSYSALPPVFPATAIVGMTDQTQFPMVAIGDTRIVTALNGVPNVVLLDPFSPSESPQPVPLDVAPVNNIAAGPGDVLYAVVQGDGADMSLDAIVLSGERVGQVLVSVSVSATEFVDAPGGVLGHGSQGIIDRRTGATLLSYVDEAGVAVSLGRSSHEVAAPEGNATSDFTVHDPDGSHDWHLVMTTASSGFPRDSLRVAPSSHGGAVAWAEVGEDAYVVAVLAADGTGTWYSLADGWQVAASDLDGTILIRMNGSTVELARLDPPQRFDFLDQPAELRQRVAYAETLPSSLLGAPGCAVDDLDMHPSVEGAAGTVYGVLKVRNKTDQPCELNGAPEVAFLDDAGNIVSSSDLTMVGRPATLGVVLEPNSWVAAPLGAVASSVCGGNESTQFRLNLEGQSVTVPFVAGSPSQPGMCDPNAYEAPGPGTLAVEPFTSVEPNAGPLHAADGPSIAIEAPTTVRAGETLKYDVVFTANVSSVVLDESNCPIYRESMSTATAQLLLNCNGTDGILIQNGESVTFHIELPIPADAALGPSTLSWEPVEPASISRVATVTIVA